LQAFFGQEAASKFTEWLWTTLKKYVPASESVMSALGEDDEDEEEGTRSDILHRFFHVT
jgi:hypothetical protein